MVQARIQVKPTPITLARLRTLLARIPGATPLGLSTVTYPAFNWKRAPFEEIVKVAEVRPMTGTVYGGAVNRQRRREGKRATFVPSSPPYTRIAPALVRYPNGVIAICAQFGPRARQVDSVVYLTRRTACGPLVITPYAKVRRWLNRPLATSARRQGLRNPVIWRTYSLYSLRAVALDGKRYIVRGKHLPRFTQRRLQIT